MRTVLEYILTGFGSDTITDFETVDILDFSTYSSDAHQILGAATQNGHDTFIDLGSDSLTLENFAVSDLTVDNIFLSSPCLKRAWRVSEIYGGKNLFSRCLSKK